MATALGKKGDKRIVTEQRFRIDIYLARRTTAQGTAKTPMQTQWSGDKFVTYYDHNKAFWPEVGGTTVPAECVLRERQNAPKTRHITHVLRTTYYTDDEQGIFVVRHKLYTVDDLRSVGTRTERESKARCVSSWLICVTTD